MHAGYCWEGESPLVVEAVLVLVVLLCGLRWILILLSTFLVRARRLQCRKWLIPLLVGLIRLGC